jgi:hypothetical protein
MPGGLSCCSGGATATAALTIASTGSAELASTTLVRFRRFLHTSAGIGGSNMPLKSAVMQRHRLILPIAVLVAIALSAADACAQSGMGGMGGGRGGRNGGTNTQGNTQGGSSVQPMTPADPSSYGQIDYRLTLLQDELGLKPEQIGLWQSFAGKVRSFADDMARERERSMTASSNLTQNGLGYIGQAVDTARNHLAGLEDVESSAKALYLALTPEQKRMVDTRLATIVLPRATATGASGFGNNLTNPGSGSKPPR